jgi:hypothetical protein
MKSFSYGLWLLMAIAGPSLSVAFSADRTADKAKTPDVAPSLKPVNNPRQITKVLEIPPRRQWDDNEGYCGETCIQAFAMYYGTYVSQYQVRAMINSDQRHELVICQNEDVVLKNLRLTYQQWDYEKQPTPQCKNYLAWVKRQLSAGHPVIGTAYMKGESDPDYDHILPFIGFQSVHDASSYHDNDLLIFYDNYDHSRFTRPFRTLPAIRQEVAKGAFAYYIPQDDDYGCAVTGIADRGHETAPVRLSVDRWDEPDVVAGEKAVVMHANLTVSSLAQGKSYSLLRYDDYHKVPDTAFLTKGGYTWRHKFTAASAVETSADTFMSNDCVIYRCVIDGSP